MLSSPSLHSCTSKATKKRYVTQQLLQADVVLPAANQLIARVVKSRGSNLHEVESGESGEHFLVSIPTKFRQTVWIKRGQFVLLEPIEEGDKVKAEICQVLSEESILHIREKGLWPVRFDADAEAMTRHYKRGIEKEEGSNGGVTENPIDPDFLPSSDESTESEGDNEVAEEAEEQGSKDGGTENVKEGPRSQTTVKEESIGGRDREAKSQQ